jgi:hypothetical protein
VPSASIADKAIFHILFIAVIPPLYNIDEQKKDFTHFFIV